MSLSTVSLADTLSESLDVPFELLSGTQTSLDLLIDETKSFDIISPGGLSYDSGLGAIFFDVNGPLFCFDFANDFINPGVRLDVSDANGDIILEALRLNNPLQYRLSTNQIAMRTPDSAACFYQGNDGFGLAGNAPVVDTDTIFSDRLENRSDLVVEFLDVPQYVRANEVLNYRISIANNGSQDADLVGFQELYPRNSTTFPEGALFPGDYLCSGTGLADCADAAPEIPTPEDPHPNPSIRGQNLTIPAGQSITFEVSDRKVYLPAGQNVGGSIDLYAGAVAGNWAISPSWDAKKVTMIVIGEGQTISAVMTNTVAPAANGDDQAIIEVTALDNNKNPTPDVFVELVNPDGLSISPASGTTGADGTFTFYASTIGNAQAGNYAPEFGAPGLQTSGVTTIANVEFVAGDPAQISAVTTTNDAIANGADQGIIQVEILDAFDNPVEFSEVSVQSPDTLSFAASAVFTDVNGIAQFAATSVDSGTFNPVFAAAGVAGTSSSSLTFVAGAPNHVEFVTQPSDVAAGVAINPPVVIRVLDEDGNLVDTDNASVITLQLRQGGQSQAFFPDLTVTNGVATFDNLTIADPGQDYSLRVFSDYPVITSQPFDVFVP